MEKIKEVEIKRVIKRIANDAFGKSDGYWSRTYGEKPFWDIIYKLVEKELQQDLKSTILEKLPEREVYENIETCFKGDNLKDRDLHFKKVGRNEMRDEVKALINSL